MHRCLIDPGAWQAGRAALPAERAHHLVRVLRVRPGETVIAFDGRGRETPARLESDASGGYVLVLPSPPDSKGRLDCEIRLLQCLPRGRRMDLIVEKATELGAADIVPVLSEHAVARPDPARCRAREERWQRIAAGAARQCGAAWIPRVHPVLPLPEALVLGTECELFVFGSLASGARPLRDVMRSAARVRSVALLVGPEGDLAPGEADRAEAAGGVPVWFGPLVLRVETAALFGLSVLAYECLGSAAGPSSGRMAGS